MFEIVYIVLVEVNIPFIFPYRVKIKLFQFFKLPFELISF